MIKIKKIDTVNRNQNIIILTSDISINQKLRKEKIDFFARKFDTKKVQHTKTIFYTYVLNSNKESKQDLRIHAFLLSRGRELVRSLVPAGQYPAPASHGPSQR